jgi:hypothetical protein
MQNPLGRYDGINANVMPAGNAGGAFFGERNVEDTEDLTAERQRLEALTSIIETALDFRGESKPNLTTVAKLAGQGQRLAEA